MTEHTDRPMDEDNWYVLDASRPAVVDGPHDHDKKAKLEAMERGPDHAVVRGDRLAERDQGDSALVWELGDVRMMTDGGEVEGAIDNEFDEAERDAREVLFERVADEPGSEHDLLGAGDIAIDLVTRQPLYVVTAVATNLVEYYEREEFDLLNYKQHRFLPVTVDDTVFECVFIGDLDDLHSFSDTYDYPAGRLARVPVEIAVEEGDD